MHNQSLLEQELTKSEKLQTGLPWRLLIFTIIIFLAVILVYLGMLLGYQPYLKSELKRVDREIADFYQKVDEEQQRNLTEFYSQLANIQYLFGIHSAASNIFGFLESNTYQGVYFTSMSLSSGKEKELKLEGLASSYRTLAEQMELLRLNSSVEQVALKDSKTVSGAVNFTIDLILKSGVLYK